MAENKKIKLLVGERLGLIRMFNEAYATKGLSLIGLQRAGQIGVKCDITATEKAEIDWKDLPTGGATLNVEKANKLELEVKFSEEEVQMIKELIKVKSETQSFASADMFIVGLVKKLGIEL